MNYILILAPQRERDKTVLWSPVEPSTQNLVQISKLMNTHTHSRKYKRFITYMMRSSRQSRVGSHASPKPSPAFSQGGLVVIWWLSGGAVVNDLFVWVRIT